MVLHALGNVEFSGANQKISGSSTSTGSFGELHIDDKVAIGSSFNAGSGSNLTLMVDGGTKTTASIGPMTYSNGMPSLWFNESIKNGDLVGHTDNYIKIRVNGDISLVNTIQKVNILEREKDFMRGYIY